MCIQIRASVSGCAHARLCERDQLSKSITHQFDIVFRFWLKPKREPIYAWWTCKTGPIELHIAFTLTNIYVILLHDKCSFSKRESLMTFKQPNCLLLINCTILSLYLSVRSVQPHSIHFRWICCLLIGISLLIEIVFDGIAFMLLCANFNTLYKDLYKFDFGY